jgi:uncharacterized protein (TIGR02246 family)
MRPRLLVTALAVILGGPALALAGPQDEVAAATRAWIEAVNSHDPGRVVTLYDPEAVLWGAQSPVLRDSPAAIRDYFEILRTFPPWYKAVLGEQRIRVYGDIAFNSGTYHFSGGRDDTLMSWPVRFSLVYWKQNGRWLIVEHHASVAPPPPH